MTQKSSKPYFAIWEEWKEYEHRVSFYEGLIKANPGHPFLYVLEKARDDAVKKRDYYHARYMEIVEAKRHDTA